MSTGSAPSTALERARIAYEQMQRREYNVAMKRRARARTRNIALAATFGGALAIIIGVTIYNGWMPESLRSSAHEGRGDKTRTAEERTAQIKSFVRGNTCQQLHFNNDNGTLVGGSLVPCETEKKGAARGEPAPQAEPQSAPKGARVNSIRDAFTR